MLDDLGNIVLSAGQNPVLVIAPNSGSGLFIWCLTDTITGCPVGLNLNNRKIHLTVKEAE